MNEIKNLNDMALKWARAHQGQQTKFLHYHPHSNGAHETIPLFENALFCLALFQTKTAESVTEAKALLEALLYFQNKEIEANKGNFPIYLHEYPHCYDKYQGLSLFPALYAIYRYFHQVIGAPLKERLEQACTLLLNHAISLEKENSLPYEFSLRLAMAAQAWGSVTKTPSLIALGKEIEEQRLKEFELSPPLGFYSPSTLGEIFLSLQMTYSSIATSPWQRFWLFLEKTWDSKRACYAGPGLKEYQSSDKPETTLYDLFCAYASQTASPRILSSQHAHIEGALIHQVPERFRSFSPLHLEGIFPKGEKWEMEQTTEYSLSVNELIIPRPENEKGIHALKLIWGEAHQLESLVSQIKPYQTCRFVKQKEGVDLLFDLHQPVDPDQRDRGKELSLFLSLSSQAQFSLSNIPTNTFQMNEPIVVKTPKLSFTLCCSLEQGEGAFFGHIMRGNRPSQIAVKGINRFNAYDYEIFLRSINRSNPCTIKWMIRIL